MSVDEKSSYYDAGGIETIRIIRAKLTNEQFEGYLLGNKIKYACRHNFKGCNKDDARKSTTYSELHEIFIDGMLDSFLELGGPQ